MGYCSASDVAINTINLLQGGQKNFTESTCPTLSAVNHWISSGCGIIESSLASRGYAVPVASTTMAYSILKDLNALYGTARAELSRTNVTLAPGERTRGQVFLDMFWKELDRISQSDLTTAGVGRSSTGKLYAGGISVSDKDNYDGDNDRVAPRFNRGQFNFPGTINNANSGS